MATARRGNPEGRNGGAGGLARAALCCAPFAAWMALMVALPATAGAYAVRSAAAAAALAASLAGLVLLGCLPPPRFAAVLGSALVGVAGGLAALFLWTHLPSWPFAERILMRSPYDPAACGWALALARLAGSAFVIAPAEELFFRFFLYRRLQRPDFWRAPLSRFDLSAFAWTVLIFTLEHDRPLAAACAGVIYGALAVRCGLWAAICAHATTNLALGIVVLQSAAWEYW